MNLSLILMIMIPITIGLSIVAQAQVKNDETPSLMNLDIFRLVFSILIIVLHSEFLVMISKDLHFIMNDVLVRIGVPFFFMISGYIVAKKSSNDAGYEKRYIKGMVKNYSFWFVVYIPVALMSLFIYGDMVGSILEGLNLLHVALVPLLIGVAFFYTGSYYHLWYFPATFLSLGVIRYWNKKQWSMRVLLGLSFLLFLFGATESYFGVLPQSIQGVLMHYYNIFYTTRNFLFFGLFFITLGYVLGKKEKLVIKYSFYKLGLFFILLVLESYALQDIERFNLNFLLMSAPVAFYLFVGLMQLPPLVSKRVGQSMRGISRYIYLVHPAVILGLLFLGIRGSMPLLFGVLAVGLSVVVSVLCVKKSSR